MHFTSTKINFTLGQGFVALWARDTNQILKGISHLQAAEKKSEDVFLKGHDESSKDKSECSNYGLYVGVALLH